MPVEGALPPSLPPSVLPSLPPSGEEIEVGILKVVEGAPSNGRKGEEAGGDGDGEGRRVLLSLRAEEVRSLLNRREAEQGDEIEGIATYIYGLLLRPPLP